MSPRPHRRRQRRVSPAPPSRHVGLRALGGPAGALREKFPHQRRNPNVGRPGTRTLSTLSAATRQRWGDRPVLAQLFHRRPWPTACLSPRGGGHSQAHERSHRRDPSHVDPAPTPVTLMLSSQACLGGTQKPFRRVVVPSIRVHGHRRPHAMSHTIGPS